MILCIGTTPAAQRVMVFRRLEIDAVNRAAETLDGFAGKSINVVKVLATLGAKPVAAGFVGGDRGRELIATLIAKGIETEFVSVKPRTRQCITILDRATHKTTELVEESRTVDPSDYDSLRAIVGKRLPDCTAVIMSGSLTPDGPVDFYHEVTVQAKQLGILSVVDAQGPPLIKALSARPTLVKPNRRELASTVGRELVDESALIEAMREVIGLGAQQVVVTAGDSPTMALDESGRWRIHSPTVGVVNPIGSGDAFTAGLVWRLTQKDNLGEACRWAAAAGAANTLSAMPGDLDRNDMERLLDQVEVERL